ncbi:hypothetical protein EDB87DRAFT_1007702 [Lactarius vividus]|nr:hypothetical protein EDB87DRAFT_1007702 [Lactarius vividus]
MHSHKTLAFLALAASTASPALSAPVLEGQQQARASAGAAGGGLGSIIKTVGSGLAFGALPTVLQDVLGGNSTRRDLPAHIIFDGLPVPLDNSSSGSSSTTPAQIIVDGLPADINSRGIVSSVLNSVKTSDSIGKVLGNGLLGGVASGVGAVGASELLNNTRREPALISSSTLSGLGKTLLGTGVSLAAADGVKEILGQRDADLVRVLQLVSRDLDERAGLGSVVTGLVDAAKTSGSIGSVIGNGLLGGVASGLGALGATELLNNTRRDDEAHALVGNRALPQLTAKDLISAFNVVARQLAELD